MARRAVVVFLCLVALLGTAPLVVLAKEDGAVGRVPPRLSYTSGDVSFWRPGAADWVPAQINTPLAPGDEVYTGHEGSLEVQVGGRAFVRAWGDTQLGLANQEPDFLQVKVTTGHVVLDLRALDAGHTVELDTPHAAFTIERPGYYRLDATAEQTSFITRRGGRATVTPPSGQAAAVSASEEVVLQGAPMPAMQSYVAPDLDVWDRWNYARTDELLDSLSARYVSAGVYGVDDLDHYGTWRVVPTYGSVWVPQAVPAGWAPYSTGHWVWDPFYGWTWVDVAPWGWAPYHHGRWVFVDGFWAWAPGPIVARPIYAPALVAFFGAPGGSVGIGGTPFISWVALGWGEPLVPWWGLPGFAGRPWWAGWGGPRVVNNVVVQRTTVVNVNTINVYRNVSVQNAVVEVPRESFGRAAVRDARIAHVDVHRLRPMRGALAVKPDARSYAAGTGRAERPPERMLSRPVIATRSPARHGPGPAGRAEVTSRVITVPPPRGAEPVRPSGAASAPPRPPFGASTVERPAPAQPRRFEPPRREGASPDHSRGPEVKATAPASEPKPAPPGAGHKGTRPTPEARSAPPGAERKATTAPPQPTPGPPGAEQKAIATPQPKPAPPGAEQRGVPRTPEARSAPPGAERKAMTAPPQPRPVPAPQAVQTPPPAQQQPGPQASRPLPGVPANRLSPQHRSAAPQSDPQQRRDHGERNAAPQQPRDAR